MSVFLQCVFAGLQVIHPSHRRKKGGVATAFNCQASARLLKVSAAVLRNHACLAGRAVYSLNFGAGFAAFGSLRGGGWLVVTAGLNQRPGAANRAQH